MSITMQSFFPLSTWCADQIASPKMGDKGMGSIISPFLKRRRTGSEERMLPSKKACNGNHVSPSLPTMPAVDDTRNPDLNAAAHTADVMVPSAAQVRDFASEQPSQEHTTSADADTSSVELTPLQQIIEHEFNMQILMKHNELRLIEQELAKCQIGLEQLRRCEVRPFAGADKPAEAVCLGTGPAVEPSSGNIKAPYAPPDGITNGPYTRHYQQWLLQDPQFNFMRPEELAFADAVSAAGRPLRHAQASRKSTSRSVAVPIREAGLPNYPSAPPKDKNQPQFLRRSTDGQLVKLVCNNCHRWNFSSIQGFLNHCRIAHKVDYKSHDAAAIDCGQNLDEHELASMPQEIHASTAPKPTPVRPILTTPVPSLKVASNSVHPLNMPSALANERRDSILPTATHRASCKPVRSLTTTQSHTVETPLRKSSQVPRLSALFAKNGIGGNLDVAAASAKQKVDLGEDDLESPEASTHTSPNTLSSVAGVRTLLGRSGTDLGDVRGPSPGSKGFRQPITSQRMRPAPLGSASFGKHLDASEVPESPQDSALHLSPHTTDMAPGLVSDNDDDNGSASEDESSPHSIIAAVSNGGPMAPHHRLSPVSARDCSNNSQLDIAMDDDLDSHAVIVGEHDILVARNVASAGAPACRNVIGKGPGNR